MLGEALDRAHRALLALTGKETILTGPADPLETTKGVISTLQAKAEHRRDMTAHGRLSAAMNLITHEAMKSAPRDRGVAA